MFPDRPAKSHLAYRTPPLTRPGSGTTAYKMCFADWSELGQLGVWRGDPGLLRAEVDEHSDVLLDADDHSEAVLVVRHLIVHRVLLKRRRGGRRVERAAGKVAPGSGAGWFHSLQYAPSRPAAGRPP